jgi:membrane fusion protein (multidrug efflux system)
MASKNIISDEALDTALNQRTLAEVSLRQAEILYKQGFVRSPIHGLVNDLFVDPGEYVQEGQKVAEVVNVDRIRLVANIPEMDVRFLNVGEEVQVRIDALPEATRTGRIEFISFKADHSTRTFQVKILVDNEGHHIRPGMMGRVRFIKRTLKEAITVPLTAILDKNGERMVFVEKEGFARARRVHIGVIENDRAQIVSGLRVGENLIVSGQEHVEDGVKVSIR